MGTNDDTSKDSGFSAASDAKPKPAFSGIVRQSDRDTLLLIIRTHISPGTRVMNDMWKPYHCQKDEGYTHLTINHNLNFADPDTGAHTQRNENTWWGVKRSSCGVSTMETILLPKHYQANRRLICVNIVCRSPVPLYALFVMWSPLHGGKKQNTQLQRMGLYWRKEIKRKKRQKTRWR